MGGMVLDGGLKGEERIGRWSGGMLLGSFGKRGLSG